MLIGVSHCPWEGDLKLITQVYQKYLIVSKPDYTARYCMWKNLLGQYKAIGWQFDIGLMSKISDGYTLGNSNSKSSRLNTLDFLLVKCLKINQQ